MGILPWNMVFLSRSHFFLLDYMHIIIITGTSLLSNLDLIVASLTLATKQRYRSSGRVLGCEIKEQSISSEKKIELKTLWDVINN